MRTLAKQMHTVVQHSGFGYGGDPTFAKGLESRSCFTKAGQALVTREGGLLFETYKQAEDAAENEMYPGSYDGIVPVAQGTFSKKQIDGLSIYIPKSLEREETDDGK